MEDSKIIELFIKRDENAIRAVSLKYGNYCKAIAKNILGNTQDAEECVSDTYLKAWNSIPPNTPSRLSAYLGRITRNLAINRYNKLNAQKRGGGETSAILEELCELSTCGSSAENEYSHKELSDNINEFLSTLSSDKRIIFVRRYWYCDSVSDISKNLGITKNNVSVTLSRLRTDLRKYLSNRGFDL